MPAPRRPNAPPNPKASARSPLGSPPRIDSVPYHRHYRNRFDNVAEQICLASAAEPPPPTSRGGSVAQPPHAASGGRLSAMPDETVDFVGNGAASGRGGGGR